MAVAVQQTEGIGNGRLDLERLQRTLLDAHVRFYRWGGWSLRRIRAFLTEKSSLPEKLGGLWANARTARTTLKAWRREIMEFVQTAKARRVALAHPE